MTHTNDNLFTIGVDLGGTKMDTAIVDSSGNIIKSHYRLVDESKDPDKTIGDIIESVKICCRDYQPVSGVGLGVAGQIDKTNGIVWASPNLPAWHNVPLKSRLEEALGLPVTINNDVRVITWGEWQHGAGKGVNDLVCLFVGTGIGGGVVSNGAMLEGCQNTAGELGHMTVVAGGRKCHCPNDGCMEAYAGGWAIAERAQDAVKANPQGGQGLLAIAGDVSKITSITVSQAYRNGDPLAQRLMKDTTKYLAAGVISIVNVFNPCMIILGGSVILGFPDLAQAVEKRVMAQALQAPRENLRIVMGKLGNKAGVIGAAALARGILH